MVFLLYFVILQQKGEWQLYLDKVLVIYAYCIRYTNDTPYFLRNLNQNVYEYTKVHNYMAVYSYFSQLPKQE